MESLIKIFKETKKILKIGDFFLYVFVLSIMLAGMLNMYLWTVNTTNRTAILEQNGVVIHTIDLVEGMENEEVRIETESYGYNLVTINYEYIEVVESTCPDQVCVGWGRIRHAGQTIVCLPYEILVRIVGETDEVEVDSVTW